MPTLALHQLPKEPAATELIVSHGMKFFKAYAHLARLALQQSRPLWKYSPKIHYFHHLVLQMEEARAKGYAALNPLSFSCSAAEDFIGRVSLVSRRVAAVKAETRVLQRWLAGAMFQWNKS